MENFNDADGSNLPSRSPNQLNNLCDSGTGVAAVADNEDVPAGTSSESRTPISTVGNSGTSAAAAYNREDAPAVSSSVLRTQPSNDSVSGTSERASTSSGVNEGIGTAVDDNDVRKEHCAICLEEKRSPVFIRCGHSFCHSCLAKHKSYGMYRWGRRCPLCRHPLKAKHRVTGRPPISTFAARNPGMDGVIAIRPGAPVTRAINTLPAAEVPIASGATSSNEEQRCHLDDELSSPSTTTSSSSSLSSTNTEDVVIEIIGSSSETEDA